MMAPGYSKNYQNEEEHCALAVQIQQQDALTPVATFLRCQN